MTDSELRDQRMLRPRQQVDYGDPAVDTARKYNVCEKLQDPKLSTDHGFVDRMRAQDFTLEYIQRTGFQQPLLFNDTEGLGMSFFPCMKKILQVIKAGDEAGNEAIIITADWSNTRRMPSTSFTVSDVKHYVGARRQVDVIDTLTQESETMSLQQWEKYFLSETRERTLNVISLEFSHTKMDRLVEPPTMVHQLDWVEVVWPPEQKRAQNEPTNDLRKMMYPKVQKYCLMSVAGCYTDFHLDFGGTSVWYHVLRGEKIFLLIPPTTTNYDVFRMWQMSGQQHAVFLADLVSDCQVLRLQAGDTFLMPSGWIHAVYTPVDSLVFGGNFLHSFNIPQQLLVHQMEENMKAPAMLRYPFYGTIHWYTLLSYSQMLHSLGIAAPQQALDSKQGATTEVGSCVSHESLAPSNGKWLKSVSIRKLPHSITWRGKWLKTVSVQRLPLPPSPALATQMSSSVSAPALLQSCVDTAYSEESATAKPTVSELLLTTKPYLSSYEKEGLLILIHKMREEQLFSQDANILIRQSSELLDHLECQLESPLLHTACSSEPNGVPLLPLPPLLPERRKLKRKGKREEQPAKLRKKQHCSLELPEFDPEPETKEHSLSVEESPCSVAAVCEVVSEWGQVPIDCHQVKTSTPEQSPETSITRRAMIVADSVDERMELEACGIAAEISLVAESLSSSVTEEKSEPASQGESETLPQTQSSTLEQNSQRDTQS